MVAAQKNHSLILALDSSSRSLTFAVGGQGRKIEHIETDKDFRHAETVVLQIDHLMKAAGVRLDEVDCFACGIGPGSFTGLRVGLAAVKALMMSRRAICFTMSTLDLIAQNALGFQLGESSHAHVLVDARQSRYYTAHYVWRDRQLIKQGTDRILNIQEIIPNIKEESVILGDGIPSFTSTDISKHLKGIKFLPNTAWYPHAAEIVRLIVENSPLLTETDIRGLKPAYLRPTEPEERLLELEKRKNG